MWLLLPAKGVGRVSFIGDSNYLQVDGFAVFYIRATKIAGVAPNTTPSVSRRISTDER